MVAMATLHSRADALRLFAARLGYAIRSAKRQFGEHDVIRFVSPAQDVLDDVGAALRVDGVQLHDARKEVCEQLPLLRALAGRQAPATLTPVAAAPSPPDPWLINDPWMATGAATGVPSGLELYDLAADDSEDASSTQPLTTTSAVQTEHDLVNTAVLPIDGLSVGFGMRLKSRPQCVRVSRRDPLPPCVRSLGRHGDGQGLAISTPPQIALPLPCGSRCCLPFRGCMDETSVPVEISVRECDASVVAACAARKIMRAWIRFRDKHANQTCSNCQVLSTDARCDACGFCRACGECGCLIATLLESEIRRASRNSFFCESAGRHFGEHIIDMSIFSCTGFSSHVLFISID